MCFVKGLVRYGLIAGLVAGAGLVIAGPDRAFALVTQTRESINCQIDKAVKDPVALRAQLRKLEGQYPARIADVRGDLAELRTQIGQLNRDQNVNQRAAELASADLSSLKGMLAKAESLRTGTNSMLASGTVENDNAPVFAVRFAGETLGIDQAYSKVTSVEQHALAFSQRVSDIERDLGYLTQQESRLATLLDQLETEQGQFQSQLWQLDRQVDAIARNDRMIDMMGKRQATIDKHSRYRAESLDQVNARVSDIRARQEAQLESLAKTTSVNGYENRARIELDSRTAATRFTTAPAKAKPPVIEVKPEDVKSLPAPTSTGPSGNSASTGNVPSSIALNGR
jgi:DNA repair exonuclease SbcCD ATPase subunit